METYKITDGFYRKIPRDGQFRGQDKIFIINYGKNIVITNVLFFYLRRCIIITKIDPKDYIGKKFNHLTITSMFKKEYGNRNNIQLLCLPYTLTDFEIEKEIINILNP